MSDVATAAEIERLVTEFQLAVGSWDEMQNNLSLRENFLAKRTALLSAVARLAERAADLEAGDAYTVGYREGQAAGHASAMVERDDDRLAALQQAKDPVAAAAELPAILRNASRRVDP